MMIYVWTIGNMRNTPKMKDLAKVLSLHVGKALIAYWSDAYLCMYVREVAWMSVTTIVYASTVLMRQSGASTHEASVFVAC